MDLRNLPDGLSPKQRVDARRKLVEQNFSSDLSATELAEEQIGSADERNCEQMFGAVALPVGYAGPLTAVLSSNEKVDLHLPLATTEGALVASVNRGCKALSKSECTVQSTYHGISRSIAWKLPGANAESFAMALNEHQDSWRAVAEATSSHLKLLSCEQQIKNGHVFLTINADTDEAMGMNMVTIAAQAIADWATEHFAALKPQLITIAANIDSDKKPSQRTFEHGRGYEVTASATVPAATISSVLKADPEALLAVAEAKLKLGSGIAGAIGANLHAANVIAALYLATGQDAAHTVEGSLAETTVTVDTSRRDVSTSSGSFLHIQTRLPAVLVGVRGGGTNLPAQSQCLNLLLNSKTTLKPCQQLAESIGAAVLAGELSLLGAQAAQHLASAHKDLGR